MENPATSWLGELPETRRFMKFKNVKLFTTEFCQWGTPWRKSTKFLACHLNLDFLDNNRCTSSQLCKRTGRPHQREDGTFWTSVAESYPNKLCNALAAALDAELLFRSCRTFKRFV